LQRTQQRILYLSLFVAVSLIDLFLFFLRRLIRPYRNLLLGGHYRAPSMYLLRWRFSRSRLQHQPTFLLTADVKFIRSLDDDFSLSCCSTSDRCWFVNWKAWSRRLKLVPRWSVRQTPWRKSLPLRCQSIIGVSSSSIQNRKYVAIADVPIFNARPSLSGWKC